MQQPSVFIIKIIVQRGKKTKKPLSPNSNCKNIAFFLLASQRYKLTHPEIQTEKITNKSPDIFSPVKKQPNPLSSRCTTSHKELNLV
jgi:hypothetical protein